MNLKIPVTLGQELFIRKCWFLVAKNVDFLMTKNAEFQMAIDNLLQRPAHRIHNRLHKSSHYAHIHSPGGEEMNTMIAAVHLW